jgi:tetratricopeptide (TPR) repeat protein
MADKAKNEPMPAAEPQTAEEFSKRGWVYLSAHENDSAVSDFKTALSIDSKLFDAVYGLGRALKAQNKMEEANRQFDSALELIDNGVYEENARAEMMRRIIRAHRKGPAAGEAQTPA